MSESARTDRSGEVVGGRYRLLEQLDRGGQGVVYRARDLRNNDDVAVKILSEANAQDATWRERMLREAHAMNLLTGTAAVRVLQQVQARDGAFCLVMELLRGVDFEQYLTQRESQGKKLGLTELTKQLEPVIGTLETAHAAGILHRDIKPRNIFVLDAGGVRLLDFGFAKFIRMRSVTQAGVVAGSPSYIAPEIWLGRTHFDQRIDVYALGAVVFRALGGSTPFSGEKLEDILRVVTTAPRPSLQALRPDLPDAIDDWIRQALAIEPDHRFTRVRALWNALCSL